MSRPKIISPCVADRFGGDNERIAEFFAATRRGGLGGLISISVPPSDDRVIVDVYRLEPGVWVRCPLSALELSAERRSVLMEALDAYASAVTTSPEDRDTAQALTASLRHGLERSLESPAAKENPK